MIYTTKMFNLILISLAPVPRVTRDPAYYRTSDTHNVFSFVFFLFDFFSNYRANNSR